MNYDMQPLVDGCAALDIELNDRQLFKFEKYLSLLLEWNQKFNLTAIKDPKEIIVQHFLDSISVLKLNIIKSHYSILDMGSGAGFPGIPIKIMLPQISLTLVDSVQKKTGFQSEVINQLELRGSEAVHARAEDLARDIKRREAYDAVVSRAVAELRVLSEYCLPFVKLKGYFISHKGPGAADEISQAQRALQVLGGKYLEIREMVIPLSEKTHNLIVVKKAEKTPKQYPRNAGKPRKTPL
jgi:16S rRNA (guanine527-N7)-methyltransferase